MTTVEQILMIKGPDVLVVPPTGTVLEAVKLMADANVGSVIVRDGGQVLGIFTERDLLCKVVACGKAPSFVAMTEVMSAPVMSCRLDDDILDCAKVLKESHIRHLAVIEDGALVGLIGLRDVQEAQVR